MRRGIGRSESRSQMTVGKRDFYETGASGGAWPEDVGERNSLGNILRSPPPLSRRPSRPHPRAHLEFRDLRRSFGRRSINGRMIGRYSMARREPWMPNGAINSSRC